MWVLTALNYAIVGLEAASIVGAIRFKVYIELGSGAGEDLHTLAAAVSLLWIDPLGVAIRDLPRERERESGS